MALFFHLRPGKLVLPFQVLQREDDVLPNREMRIERIVLKHHAHSAFFRRQRRHVLIPEKDLATGRLFQAADHVQRRTFSTARGAQKADEFPVGDLEIKSFTAVTRLLFLPLPGKLLVRSSN